MQIDLKPFVISWSVLAVTVIALIAWRKTVTAHFDYTLKLQDVGAVSQQATGTHKLDVIDRWGKILTGISLVSGLMIGLAYAYQSWVESFPAL